MDAVVGTLYYMAPEIATKLIEGGSSAWGTSGTYTKEVDIWSLGVLLFMILTGAPPFRMSRDNEMAYLNSAVSGDIRWTKEFTRMPEAKDLVTKMLQVDYRDRLSLEGVLAHAWCKRAHKEPTDADAQLTMSVVHNLAKFGKINTLKRVAAQIAAFTISPAKIKELRHSFMQLDQDGSGVLTIDEFKEAMSNEGMDMQMVTELFNEMDIDGTGGLEYSEFMSAALLVTRSLTEEEVIDAFDKLDSDADGAVEKEELIALLSGHMDVGEIEPIIAEIDGADGVKDGRVGRAGFLNAIRHYTMGKESAAFGDAAVKDVE